MGFILHIPIIFITFASQIIVEQNINNMGKVLKMLDVINRFHIIHGDRYDYSLISESNYIDTKHRVPIKCNTCGIVWYQTPHSHLNGQGCPNCANKNRNTGKMKKRNKKVYGVGINDFDGCINEEKGKHMLSYRYWRAMIQRCYDEKFLKNHNTYVGCCVCDEWLFFSNFKKWFDKNYVENYELDKDILVKGNKEYSPEKCCFVPHKINSIILGANSVRGGLPIGVSIHNGKFVATHHASKTWGKSYSTKEDAFKAYKQAKEGYLKKVAKEYYNVGKIDKKVYDALMNYKIDITD